MSTYEAIDLMINAIGATLLLITVIIMIVELKTKKINTAVTLDELAV